VSSQIQILDYDPLWPEVFRREADRIRTLLGCRALQIERSAQSGRIRQRLSYGSLGLLRPHVL